MKILFLTPQMPFPARQGTAIRNWGLMSGVARRHTVALLTFAPAGEPIHAMVRAVCTRVATVAPPARSLVGRVGTLLFSREADLARRLASPVFEAALERMLREWAPDVVQVEGLELGRYVRVIRRVRPEARVVFDAHNAEVMIQRRAFQTDVRRVSRWPAALYSWLQQGRLARFERATVKAADRVVCVSAEDAAVLRDLAGVEAVVAPNGLNVAEYEGVLLEKSLVGDVLLFTGKMDYRPNVDAVRWFANAVFPKVWEAWPAARFVIAGQRPTGAVLQLGDYPGITVTGAVPEIKPYIAAAAVYVAPLRMGGGTRFKLLEAMALRKPVVSTTIGAEGFAVEDGRELRLADSAGDFAAAVLDLLQDRTQRMALGNAGRAFVAAHYDWEMIVPVLEAVYSD